MAEKLLKQAMALDPGFYDAQAALVSVYFRRAYNLGGASSWADSGVVLARRAVEADTALRDGYGALGFNYLELGRLSDAERVYRKISALQPSDDRAAFVLAWIQFLRGNLTEAVALWEEAQRIDPLDATIPVNMAFVEVIFGDHRRAERWLEEARALDPDHPYLPLGHARLLLAEGRRTEAAAEAERFLSERPRFFLALESAALMSTLVGDYRRAREPFEELERLAPDDWNFWGLTYRTYHGYVLIRLGEVERGERLLERVLQEARRMIREGDERPGIRREIAAIHAAMGDEDEAYEWLARAIDVGWRFERAHPSPLFEALRGEERFRRLVGRIDGDVARMKKEIEGEGLGSVLE